jgi:hypothetical protein
MRPGNVRLEVDGRTFGTGLVTPLLAAMIAQNGSPDAIAQKADDYLAGQVPPQTRPQAEHDRDAELYRAGMEPSMNSFAQGIVAYLRPQVAVAADADQVFYPVLANVFYAPSGSLTATRTLSISYAPPSTFSTVAGRTPDGLPIIFAAAYNDDDIHLLDGDFVLVRNDSAHSLNIVVQQGYPPTPPPPPGLPPVSPVLPAPVALGTVLAGGWAFALQIAGVWRVLAGS